MWLVMRVRKWEFEGPVPIRIDAGKSIGYVAVYDTLADAQAEYPQGPFTEVKDPSRGGRINVAV